MISIAPLDEVFGLVKGTEAAPSIDPAAEKMAIGVRATVSTKIRAWAYLPDPEPGQSSFSVRRFVENESGGDAWLFLTSRKDQHAFLRPLLSLWCDQAAASILSLPPDLKRRFWVVLDEVASLQELPALTPDGGLLTMSRKHGGATILGLQDIGQLRRLYGVYGAQSISGIVPYAAHASQCRVRHRGVGGAVAWRAGSERGDRVALHGPARLARCGEPAAPGGETPDRAAFGDHESAQAVGLSEAPGGFPVTKVTLQVRERRAVAPIYVSRHGEVAL